jgi:hypothetical protein
MFYLLALMRITNMAFRYHNDVSSGFLFVRLQLGLLLAGLQ